MGKESLRGLMAEDMKANILMIKKKGSVLFTGLMVGNTRVDGGTGSNME